MSVVEREELINLESVERNYLKLRKSGVDEALRLTIPVLFPVTGSETRYTSTRQLIASVTLKRFSCTGSSLSLFILIYSKDAETPETIPTIQNSIQYLPAKPRIIIQLSGVTCTLR